MQNKVPPGSGGGRILGSTGPVSMHSCSSLPARVRPDPASALLRALAEDRENARIRRQVGPPGKRRREPCCAGGGGCQPLAGEPLDRDPALRLRFYGAEQIRASARQPRKKKKKKKKKKKNARSARASCIEADLPWRRGGVTGALGGRRSVSGPPCASAPVADLGLHHGMIPWRSLPGTYGNTPPPPPASPTRAPPCSAIMRGSACHHRDGFAASLQIN